MKQVILNLSLVLLSTSAFANDCVLRVSRQACPGKQSESYSKCGGQQSCDQVEVAASAETCRAVAIKACENKRFDVTQYKSVQARYKGAELAPGTDFCAQDSGAYVVSKNYPFRNAADCK